MKDLEWRIIQWIRNSPGPEKAMQYVEDLMEQLNAESTT